MHLSKAGIRWAAGAVALGSALALVAVRPAEAGSNVTVSLSNVSPTRTVTVTDWRGNDLTTGGFALGTSTASSSTLSAPFRVTVQDGTMTPSNFDVEAEMTNLYLCTGNPCTIESAGSVTSTNSVPSSDISLNFGSNALTVANVSALVAPLFNLVGPVGATACTDILALNPTDLGGVGCPNGISLSNIPGLGQTLNQVANIASLATLPLVPQTGANGTFTNPVYGTPLVSNSYAPSNAPAASQLAVVKGTSQVATVPSIITALQSQVNVPATGNLSSEIDVTNQVVPALRSALGTSTAGSNLGSPVWDLLGSTDQTSIINGLVATLVNLTASSVVGLTGTYESSPTLNVAVPSTNTGGSYEGTLVFTGF